MIKSAAALVLSAMLSNAVLAAPAALTEQQMDAVTAGVAAYAQSVANAIGHTTDTDAVSRTEALEGALFSVAWGFTKGYAFAQGRTEEGDWPRADSKSYADGEGDIVKKSRGRYKRSYRDTRIASSWAFVVAVDINVDMATLTPINRLLLSRQIHREISSLTGRARSGRLL